MRRRVLAAAAASVAACVTAAVVAVTVGLEPAQASDNGAAATPPMGWSSWSFVRSSPTEAKIKAQAKAMHDTGLVDHGYKYVNLDDYYILNPGTTVDQYGRWAIDRTKFPDGMANVADYLHGLGEKFGMYVTPGIPVAAYNQNTPIEGTSFHARDIVSNTSSYERNYGGFGNVMYFVDYQKNPGAAQAFVNSWAKLFASYGIDYLKIDGVGSDDIPDITAWSSALRQSGRLIHYGLSNSLPIAQASTWRQYANSWRINGDIESYCCGTLTNWNNITSRFTLLPQWARFAGPGGWNDPDSLELGNGSADGLTVDERRSTMTLWAVSAAPLLLGSDLTAMDQTDLGMLTNDEVVAVDQAGIPALPVSQSSPQQVWRSTAPDGSYVVALFNLGGSTATVTANWSDLGFTGTAGVRDLWSHTDLGNRTGSFSRSLPAHGSALLRVTPGAVTPLGGPLVSTLSGRCADVPAGSTTNGTRLTVFDCNNGTNQKVTYSASARTLTVLGKCFDAHGQATASGTHVELYDCTGGANQQWNVNGNGTITGVQSGICLDVEGTSNPNGTGLELWTCNGGDNQRWTVGPGVRVP